MKENKVQPFQWPTTAWWRSYVGTWEIRKNEILLINLRAWVDRFKEVGLDYLFPRQTEVKANWFSGELTIRGLEYEFSENYYDKEMYEKDIVLLFKNGTQIFEQV